MDCPNCKKQYKSKGGLTRHIKSCKNPICDFCESSFFDNRNLKRHLLICKQKKQIESEKKEEAQSLKEKISSLEHKILENENKFLKTLPVQQVQVNNNVIINNNLVAFTDDMITQATKKINPLIHKTFDDMCNVLLEEFKHSAVLVDIARKTLEVNIDGKVLVDPEGFTICDKIAKHQAIKEKNKEYKQIYCQKEIDRQDQLLNAINHNKRLEQKRKEKIKHKEEKAQARYRRNLIREKDSNLYDYSSDEDSVSSSSESENEIQISNIPDSGEDYTKIIIESEKLINVKHLQRRLPKRFRHKSHINSTNTSQDILEGLNKVIERFYDLGLTGFLFYTPEKIAKCLDSHFSLVSNNFEVVGDDNLVYTFTRERLEIIIRMAFEKICPGLEVVESVLKSFESVGVIEEVKQLKINLRWARDEDETDSSFMDRVMNSF
jgi:hypothetical protein